MSGSSFWASEELGIAAPKSCSNCRNCKACSFISSQLSFKEQQEYQIISENLKYDPPKKKWIAKYPLTEDPILISDTKTAASKMLESLEKRLQKAKLAEEYGGQIKDFINRGVISKMTDEEIKENPIGYVIPHNFVHKPGSATTPLRVVTNSSYKSHKSGLSLNCITMKGPPSLNSLINVLIKFRGFKFGLVADIAQAFLNIRLLEKDRNYVKFIWFKNKSRK